MAEVVPFHSALGLRPGVISAADRLRAAGHAVRTPDCHDGDVFDDLDDGLPTELVFAGFSFGAVPAGLLAATRPGALGAILMHAAVPVGDLAGLGAER